jgi:Uma2 family endonuclease
VEVADTSLGFDRDVKLPHYAEAGIAEAWLVDLNSQTIEVHSGAGPGGDRVESATHLGLVFDANEALPPKEPDVKG